MNKELRKPLSQLNQLFSHHYHTSGHGSWLSLVSVLLAMSYLLWGYVGEQLGKKQYVPQLFTAPVPLCSSTSTGKHCMFKLWLSSLQKSLKSTPPSVCTHNPSLSHLHWIHSYTASLLCCFFSDYFLKKKNLFSPSVIKMKYSCNLISLTFFYILCLQWRILYPGRTKTKSFISITFQHGFLPGGLIT